MALSMAQRVAALTAAQRSELLGPLTDGQVRALQADWRFWARPEQLAPAGDWTTWMILAGRGFGKTRAGAEWVLDRCDQLGSHDPTQIHRVALMGETAADVRGVMVEGESGLVACARRRGWRTLYEPSKRNLTIWTPDGRMSLCTAFSAEDPDQPRGFQSHTAWIDEEASHKDKRDAEGNTAVSNLELGLRLGEDPRAVSTTTPKPTKTIRDRVADPAVAVTRGTTYDNLQNLAASFRRRIVAKYEGTRLGRQELNAELLDDVQGALWSLDLVERQALRTLEGLGDVDDVVVAIDPPASQTGDECGIVIAARIGDAYYVLEDLTEGGLSPHERCVKAIRGILTYGGSTVVIETNNGGDWLPSALRNAADHLARTEGLSRARGLKIRTVTATRGKRLRAEPVVGLYEQSRVWHVRGTDRAGLAGLEEQMTTWVPDVSSDSPDRVDALVWAITYLADLGAGAKNKAYFRVW